MRRLVWILLLVTAIPLSAAGQDAGGGIEVIDVSGPLDARALTFMSDSIEHAAQAGQEVLVLQLSSRAVLDRDSFDRLTSLLSPPPLPVAVWVGPAPATVYGGAADLAHLVENSAIAPGSTEGHHAPTVLGEGSRRSDEVLSAEDSGLELQPTLRQYLQALDGRTFETVDGERTVSTLEPVDGGVTLKQTTLRKPGLTTRFFRLGVTPEAAFFFLVAGLTLAVFEFYALGPGVAAAVAALSLVIAGSGIAVLPMRWWAVAVLVLAFVTLVAAHQLGGLFVLSAVGAILLQVSGMYLIEGSGQLDPRWWLVLPTVLVTLFFFLIAMPTVQRARLSTETIGRGTLIGETGTAIADFDPDGYVEVNGARWKATAHRESGISEGDAIVVNGVDGLYLEVERVVTGRET